MRRKDHEITDIRMIEQIVAGARILHLGMNDDGAPYVVPMHYGYRIDGEDLTFYVHCANEGHKLDCLRKDDRVFVEIDRERALITADVPCRYGAAYESVMCRGRAVIVTDPEEKCRALALLMKTQTGTAPQIDRHMAEAVTVIRLDVRSTTAKARFDEKGDDGAMTREEAIEAYTQRFGGWPHFLMMGASDEGVVECVKEALKTGEKIKPVEGRLY